MTPFWKVEKWSYNIHPNKQNLFGTGPPHTHTLKARGGSGVKKTSLAYIKVQLVIEVLFTESQNLRL